MKFKFILPALTEAESPFWRPIKYSLFPPLGLATLAGWLSPDDEAEIVDQHVQELRLDDAPSGMQGMGRVFQGAATVDSILDGDLVEEAAQAGLRSLFVGFESLDPRNLQQSNKRQNLDRDYTRVINRLHELGIMINGSFVFGLDGDDPSVFSRTVNWAVDRGITTATFHIATPYPGTAFHAAMQQAGRIFTEDWDLFDTRHVTFEPANMTAEELRAGYDQAYRDFYTWSSIFKASLSHGSLKHQLKHFFYASGWKKFEPVWNTMIQLKRLGLMTPMLEAVLSKVTKQAANSTVGLAAGEAP